MLFSIILNMFLAVINYALWEFNKNRSKYAPFNLWISGALTGLVIMQIVILLTN